MSCKNTILQVIYNTLDDINQRLEAEAKIDKSPQTDIFGPNRELDSLGLIDFVVGVEKGVQDKFSITLNLAGEESLSEGKGTVEDIAELISSKVDAH